MSHNDPATKTIEILISAVFNAAMLFLILLILVYLKFRWGGKNGLTLQLACLFMAFAAGGAGAAHAAPPDVSTLKATFGDEFSGPSLDVNHGDGWVSNYTTPRTINNELEAYTPDALVLDTTNGILRLRADKRSYGGMSYTSGSITTFAKFHQTYGYFIMRAKLPAGKGLWPGFWLLQSNGQWPPELDVMENLASDPHTVFMTNHWSEGQSQTEFTGPDFSAGYHTFALEWRPDVLIWYIDNIERRRYAGPGIPQSPMYMLVNLAVGGRWPGAPDQNTLFPQSLDIDYVRAYQFDPPLVGAIPNTVTLSGILVSKQTVKAGEKVTITSRATVGPDDLPNGVYEIGVCGYWGSPCYAFDVQPATNLNANSIASLTFNYEVSPSLPDGWYNVYVTLIAGSASSSSAVATRFAVQNGRNGFIASPPSLAPALVP